MINKRDYLIQYYKEKGDIEKLRLKLKHELQIISSTEKSNSINYYLSPNSQSYTLPIVQTQRYSQKTDRYVSQKIKYQTNLKTIINQIKQKIEGGDFSFQQRKNRRPAKQNKNLRSLDLKEKPKFCFDIMTLSAVKQRSVKNKSIGRQYSLKSDKNKISTVKFRHNKRLSDIQKYQFSPWNSPEEFEFQL